MVSDCDTPLVRAGALAGTVKHRRRIRHLREPDRDANNPLHQSRPSGRNPHSYRTIDRDCDLDPDRNTENDFHTNSYDHRDTDANFNADENVFGEHNSHPDVGYIHAYTDADRHSHQDLNIHRDRHTYSEGDGQAEFDAHAACNEHSGTDYDIDCDTTADPEPDRHYHASALAGHQRVRRTAGYTIHARWTAVPLRRLQSFRRRRDRKLSMWLVGSL